jgi:hypothetical protein
MTKPPNAPSPPTQPAAPPTGRNTAEMVRDTQDGLKTLLREVLARFERERSEPI